MRKHLHAQSARWGVLSYRKSGDFPGTALVLVHGAIGDSRLFRYQLKHFGSEYKTIAIDLPGHGHSLKEENPSLDDFINAIEDILEEEKISSFILIGHSMGGGVCLEACKRSLNGLVGMVLISTSPVLPVSQKLIDILERSDMDSLAELLVRSVFSKKVDILIGFAKQGMSGMNEDLIKNDIEICRQMDYCDILASIKIPVLVIATSGDQLISKDMTATFTSVIPNSRLVVFESDGHVPFFENAQAFNQAVDIFIKEIVCD